MAKSNKRKYFFILFFTSPLWVILMSYLFWKFQAKTPINAVIVDKAVLNQQCNEHRSFNWMLDHKGYSLDSNSYYSPPRDYYGFFPKKDQKFILNDFEKMSSLDIENFADSVDILYYTDTYGIYRNEWYKTGSDLEHSQKVYGGLTLKDYTLIESCIARQIPVITEFNLLASPTSTNIRKKTEELLNIKWTGWTGRYFEDLDTNKNKEIPRWVINLQLDQYDNVWDFKKSGIVFVSNTSKIVIIENKRHLNSEFPHIICSDYGQEEYSISKKTTYPFWFDITFSTDTCMKEIASYEIKTNDEGSKKLNLHGIPKSFPAILMKEHPSPVFYFCGDFCDNPIKYSNRKFKGIEYISFLFDKPKNKSDRSHFFWRVYEPMMSRFLDKYLPQE